MKSKRQNKKVGKKKKLGIEEEAKSLNVDTGFHRAVVRLLKTKPLKKK